MADKFMVFASLFTCTQRQQRQVLLNGNTNVIEVCNYTFIVINDAFSGDSPKIIQWHCIFHVMRALQKSVIDKFIRNLISNH